MDTQTLQTVFTPMEDPDPPHSSRFSELLAYPFSYIPEYDITSFCRTVLGEEQELDPGNFPHNIAEYYWIQEGENDGDDWICLCKLDNGYYVYYSANCDYTGFDCQGGMEMYVASTRDRLFYHGLTEEQRRKILRSRVCSSAQ